MARTPPPIPREGPHKGNGWCWFCGGEILAKSTPKGQPCGPHERVYPQRCSWHNECLGVYQMATSSEVQRSAVFGRDRGICAACGDDCTRIVSFPGDLVPADIVERDRGRLSRAYARRCSCSFDRGLCGCWVSGKREIARLVGEVTGPFCKVRFGEFGWQADHIVPLWRAPREWYYFGLDNLQLLCRSCHKKKSAAEAKERAALKRESPEPAGAAVRRGPAMTRTTPLGAEKALSHPIPELAGNAHHKVAFGSESGPPDTAERRACERAVSWLLPRQALSHSLPSMVRQVPLSGLARASSTLPRRRAALKRNSRGGA